MTEYSKTPLLDTIRTPDDLRRLKVEQVRQVADELRQETGKPGAPFCPSLNALLRGFSYDEEVADHLKV